jgi:SAM-dependent methyltransferase
MKQETSNAVRFILQDLLPPLVRDSSAFRWLADAAVGGGSVSNFAQFRQRAPFLTPDEYQALYQSYTNVHASGDNSQACLERIAADVLGDSLLDAGCGGGHLLKYVRSQHPAIALTGIDIAPPHLPNVENLVLQSASIEALPFPDRRFDKVVSTHCLEHVLDIRLAIAELRRVTAKRLIMIVPQEREGLYTFNPHFHFFPYKETFLRTLVHVPANYVCAYVGRDIYYREDRDCFYG